MKEDKNPFVAIVAVTGGIFFVTAIVFLIFAKEQLALLVPIVWAFVVMAVMIAFFTHLSGKKK
jgi:hypothetical protein